MSTGFSTKANFSLDAIIKEPEILLKVLGFFFSLTGRVPAVLGCNLFASNKVL